MILKPKKGMYVRVKRLDEKAVANLGHEPHGRVDARRAGAKGIVIRRSYNNREAYFVEHEQGKGIGVYMRYELVEVRDPQTNKIVPAPQRVLLNPLLNWIYQNG